MRFPPTATTPALDRDAIPKGGRGSPDGLYVYRRCDNGHLYRLGRPHRIDQTLDDVPDAACPECPHAKLRVET